MSLEFASSLAAAVAGHYASNHENLLVEGPQPWKEIPMKRKLVGSSQRYEMRDFPVCDLMVEDCVKRLSLGINGRNSGP